MSAWNCYKILLNQEFIDKTTYFTLSNKGHEVGGWIFGNYEKNIIHIKVAERDNNAVESASGLRIRSIPPIEKYPDLEIVGGWHTHPAGFASFSYTDMKTMENWVRSVIVTDVPKIKPKVYFISSPSGEGVDWALFTPEIKVDMDIFELKSKSIKISKIQEYLKEGCEELSGKAGNIKEIRNLIPPEDEELELSEIGEKISQIIKLGEDKGILVLKQLEEQLFTITVAPYPSLFKGKYSYEGVFGVWFEACGLNFSSVEKAFLLNFSTKIGRKKFLVANALEDGYAFREVEMKSDRYSVEIIKIPQEAIEIIASKEQREKINSNLMSND